MWIGNLPRRVSYGFTNRDPSLSRDRKGAVLWLCNTENGESWGPTYRELT
jgi:hypothetical protein